MIHDLLLPFPQINIGKGSLVWDTLFAFKISHFIHVEHTRYAWVIPKIGSIGPRGTCLKILGRFE